MELLQKFERLNKEKYNGDLNYIIIDFSNNQTLLYLIELLRQSIKQNDDTISNDEINFNKIERFVNNDNISIKKNLHKLITKKTYDNHDEFWRNINSLDGISLLDIGRWWGENGYGMERVIVTNNKEIYKCFCEEALKPTRYELDIYDPLSDEEFNNLIDIIKNNLLDVPEENNMIFDTGNFITINYNGIIKKFENIYDINGYKKIKDFIENLFV